MTKLKNLNLILIVLSKLIVKKIVNVIVIKIS